MGAAHPVLPINDQRCTMHISTGRAGTGHSLRVQADRAGKVKTDIQITPNPENFLHRRKAA